MRFLQIVTALVGGFGIVALYRAFVLASAKDRLAPLRIHERLDALLRNAGVAYDPFGKLPEGVRAALRENRKIAAIRLYREASGAGLKAGKAFIEDMMSSERQAQKKLDALLKHAGIPFEP